MAGKTVTIPLAEPILGHEGMINKVVLREPTFDELLAHGEVTIYTRGPDGTVFTIENLGAIRAYIGCCLVEPKDDILIGQGGFELAYKIKEAIHSFFRAAAMAAEPSTTSPTSSSSNAEKGDSTQAPSAG